MDLVFVIPFRNEERFIEATLDSLLAQDMGEYSAEIWLLNGMSTDRSREIVEKFTRTGSRGNLSFVLMDNPGVNTPAAFNLGIAQTTAPMIGFGGAHTSYPSNYLRAAIELLGSVDADVVGGGHDKIISLDPGVFSQAISCLYLSPMGAGVAAYHRIKSPDYVDTVYGGFYKREVFNQIGLFNETLLRNQDNELNARVTKAGLKIYFHPALSTTYIQKTDPISFLKRAYMFGFFHPATWRASPSSFRLRHFVPAMWVLYLASLIIFFATMPQYRLIVLLPLLIYTVLLGISSIRFVMDRSFLVGLVTFPLFAVYHILYGVGTFAGLFDLLINSRSSRTVKQRPVG